MAGESPDLSGILGSLLSNPAALKTAMGLFANQKKETEGSGSDTPHTPPQEELRSLLPPPKAAGRRSERERLLSALSPYLSPERQRALAGAEKLLEVLELLDNRKGDI